MERKHDRESERLRVPQPMIKKRIASGRGAMEQPNVTHDGDAALSPRFWIAIVIVGIITGLFGDLLMWLLKLAGNNTLTHYTLILKNHFEFFK